MAVVPRARIRIAMITCLTALFALVLPGVAKAEPPSNDDFDSSTAVTTLPFAVSQDTSGATRAGDDPLNCEGFAVGGTVWFSFTPTENMVLQANTNGSGYTTILSAYTGGRGAALTPVPGACDPGFGFGSTVTFLASAGATYHFMVAGHFTTGGALSFALDAVPPAPNDNFAAAEPLTLPSTRLPDMSGASVEPDEPRLPCVSQQTQRSVWYTFTPAEPMTVVAQVDQFDSSVAVLTGSVLPDLQVLGCSPGGFFDPLVFRAAAGVTYHIDVAGPASLAAVVTLSLTQAPALQPSIGTNPFDPTIYEQTQFFANAGDQLGQPVTGGEWSFGDGTTAPVAGNPTPHLYSSDGTYQVRLTVITRDGRTGTVSRAVTVSTHDVAVTKFSVPDRARTGDTKPITVHVENIRYPETVTVVLYKSEGQSWTQVGTLTQDVPARPDRTVRFPFAYTFTPADAVVGRVTFRTVISMSGRRDARPMDNEVIAIATTVRPSLADLRWE